MGTTLGVGTDKGGWLLRSDDRRSWTVEGPFFTGWQVTAFGTTASGDYLAGTASGWFGPGVHRSTDLQEWTQVVDGPAFPAEDPTGTDPKVERIWHFSTDPTGRIWCGVAQAGLFTSDDDGETWQPVEAYNTHPTRPKWIPGAGGMCLHRVLTDDQRIWAAASSIGVLRSDDGGASFQPANRGVEGVDPDGADDGIGTCVHAVVADPDDPDTIWRQDHSGVYRTTDGADSWQRIEQGLPANFGFPIVRDPGSGALFVVPLEADVNRTPVEGRFAAYRSTDGGESWQASGVGWPDEPTYDTVLRGAMAVDGDGGVYAGTTGGRLWATDDAGDSWHELPGTFPRIHAVAVL